MGGMGFLLLQLQTNNLTSVMKRYQSQECKNCCHFKIIIDTKCDNQLTSLQMNVHLCGAGLAPLCGAHLAPLLLGELLRKISISFDARRGCVMLVGLVQ